MSKKTVKILLIILLILFVIFIINLGRKTYIMAKYNSVCEENSKITNFYKKSIENDEVLIKTTRKDDVGIYKRMSDDGVRMIYYGEENDWIIIDTVDSEGIEKKQAVKIPKNEYSLIMPSFGLSSIYTENFFQTVIMAFASKITTEQVNGIECYKIYLDEDVQVFINKDDYLRVKEINASTSTTIIEYTTNEVTDEDVKMPDLEGFEIIEPN